MTFSAEPGHPDLANFDRQNTQDFYHGEETPGSVVYLPVSGGRDVHAELQTKN